MPITPTGLRRYRSADDQQFVNPDDLNGVHAMEDADTANVAANNTIVDPSGAPSPKPGPPPPEPGMPPSPPVPAPPPPPEAMPSPVPGLAPPPKPELMTPPPDPNAALPGQLPPPPDPNDAGADTPAAQDSQVGPQPYQQRQKQRPSVADRLESLGAPPQMPQENWAQKLGRVVLGFSKLAPQTDNILHPGYTAQRNAYGRQVADIEGQSKAQDMSEYTKSRALSNQERALELQAKAGQLQQDASTRAQTEADRAKNSQRVMVGKLTKGKPYQYIPKGQAAQFPGWQVIPGGDPDAPNYDIIIPESMQKVPKELLPYIPGSKEGSTVDLNTYTTAYTAFLKEKQATDKPQTPKTARLDPTSLALRAVGADPDHPESITPEQATAARQQLIQDKQAIHIHTPKSASVGELKHQESQRINQLAKRALADTRQGGSTPESAYDDAITNLQNPQFYQNDDMDDYREEVAGQIRKWQKGVAKPAVKTNPNDALKSILGGGNPQQQGAPQQKVAPQKGIAAKPAAAPQQQQAKLSGQRINVQIGNQRGTIDAAEFNPQTMKRLK